MSEDERHIAELIDLSVLITAFNRRQFLGAAIRSAVLQSLPSSRYEVIVLANFDLTESDIPAGAKNVRVVFDDAPRAGQTVARGIREARGRIITTLDDDDLYGPDRLSRVLDFFNRHPGLSYYHNAFSLFSGEPDYRDRSFRPTTTKSVVGRLWPAPSQGPGALSRRAFLRFLSSRSHERNASSIALSRDFAQSVATSYERVEGHTDTYLLFAALCGSGTLGFDFTPLTMVRRHPGNSSISASDLSKRRRSWKLIREMTGESEFNPMLDQFLRLREARSIIFEHLVGEPATRREVWRATEVALRSAPFSGIRNTLIYSALGFAGTLSIPQFSAIVPFIEG